MAQSSGHSRTLDGWTEVSSKVHCKTLNSELEGGIHGTSDDRWRELFPLPLCEDVERQAGLSVSARRRRAHVRSTVEQTNSVIRSLNEMYAPSHKGEFSFFSSPSSAQKACQHEIFKEVSRHKRPPSCMPMREAVQELLQTDLAYSGEVATTVRSYDKDLLSIPSSGNQAVDLNSVLDEVGRDTIGDPQRCMLLSEDEWGMEIEKNDPITTYMDPALRDDLALYCSFIQDLHSCGMLEFTNQPQGLVTPFCVAKKNGRLRLILDCRDTNRRFKTPPPLALGTGSSWARVNIPQGEDLYIAQSDIKDYFYSLQLPASLRPLFSMPAVPNYFARQLIGGAEHGGLVSDEGWIYPMLRVVPMGWSWAMWLSQRVHQYQSQLGAGVSEDRVLVDGKPCPDLSSGEVLLLPYADNLNVAGIDAEKVQKAKDSAVSRLRAIGLIVHEELDACSTAQSLGFLIDGKAGRVTPVPARLHRVQLAFQWLSRRPRVRGKSVQRLLGHAVHFLMLKRELLSVFRHLYDFVTHAHDKKCRLWQGAAVEARWMSCLLTLCAADLRKSFSPLVTASDASLSGIAVCKREARIEDVLQNGAYRESWRFKGKCPSSRPRSSALSHGDPFEDPQTVRPIRPEWGDPFELVDNFQEISQNILEADFWHLCFSQHMQIPEHITLLEGRGIVAALRHKLRSISNFGMAHLHLNDNLGMVLALDKGRSSSMSLLRVCRRVACLLIATSSSLCCRWIPSETNVADAGSRRWEYLRTGNADVKNRSKNSEADDQGEEQFHQAGVQDVGAFKCGNEKVESSKSEKNRLSSRKEPKACHTTTVACQRSRGQSSEEAGIQAGVHSSSPFSGTEFSGRAGNFARGGSRLSVSHPDIQELCKEGEVEHKGPVEFRQVLGSLSERALRFRMRRRGGNKVFGGGHRCRARLRPQEQPPKIQTLLAGVDEIRSRSNQTAHSMGVGGIGGISDDERKRGTSSIACVSDVRGISSSRRSSSTQARRFGDADSSSPILLSEPSSVRTAGDIKGGAIRRKRGLGLSNNSMVGLSTQGPTSQKPQRLHVRPDLSRSEGDLGASSHIYRSENFTRSSVSIEAFGSITRPIDQEQEPSGSEEAWEVVKRLFSQALRGTCKSGTGISEVAKAGAGERNSSAKTTASLGPKIFLPKEEEDLKVWFVEIFSGSAHMSQAMSKKGFRCAAWDIEYNSGCNILDPAVIKALWKFILQHHVVLIWLGMPCQSWSRARRWDGGPPPLRDDAVEIWGRQNLNKSDKQKTLAGNVLLLWTTTFVTLCNILSIPWIIENPWTSRSWNTPDMQRLIKKGASLHQVDYCQYGVPWRKSTGLMLFGIPQIASILKTGCPNQGRCSRTSKRHIILSGKDSNDVWWTHRAQPYPHQLCYDIACFMASTLHV